MPVFVVLSEVSESPALVRWGVHFAHGERTGLIVLDATGKDGESGSASKESDRIVQVGSEESDPVERGTVLEAAAQAIEEQRGNGERHAEGEAWPEVELWRCRWRGSPHTRILRFRGQPGSRSDPGLAGIGCLPEKTIIIAAPVNPYQ